MPEQRIRAEAAALLELLPPELIVVILLRIPLKYLLRLSSVSKSLRAVVDSAEFINSHLATSSQNLNLRKLIFLDPRTNLISACDVEEGEKEILRLQNPVSCPPPLEEVVYGYCNGLILLSRTRRSGLALWNPSTRRFRDLPDVPSRIGSGFGYNKIGSGLGYDDSTDDYKVFLKVSFGHGNEDWIYGLKSNIWRRSKHINPLINHRFLGTGEFADNTSLYWLCTIYGKPEIVSFDFRTDTFSLIPQPPVGSNDHSINELLTKVHVLKGCLCITYFSTVKADSYIRNKDDGGGGGQFTWTPLYSISESCLLNDVRVYRLKVLGYSKKGDKILLDHGMGNMVLYDLEKKSYERVEIYKDFDCFGSMLSCLCLESLVSL